MEGNKDDKQQISQGNIVNNSTNSLSKILSPYLPKDVLEESDIVDSSKINSYLKIVLEKVLNHKLIIIMVIIIIVIVIIVEVIIIKEIIVILLEIVKMILVILI